MARAEDHSASDEGGSESDDSAGYASDSTGGDSNTGSYYDSEGGSDDEVEGDSKEAEKDAAKKQRVQADVDEMRRMMADMDAVRARLQQRFAAERQARQDQIEVQDAARCRAEEEARARQVEAAVQTDALAAAGCRSQPELKMPQGALHLAADGAADRVHRLSAVDGKEGGASAAPIIKAKPAGLSLYDLVKASEIGPSRKARTSIHQPDPPAALSPAHASNVYELAATERNEHVLDQGPGPDAVQEWDGINSQQSHHRDSVLGGDSGRASRHRSANIDSMRSHLLQSKAGRSLQYPPRSDENSPSVSNSLVSSRAGSDRRSRSAAMSDLTQRRDHRFNAAALLSATKRASGSPGAIDDDDNDAGKTDEQREMEAIQCLLFQR